MFKRGVSHIDWAISIGIFLVLVLSIVVFLRPGVETFTSHQALVQTVESNLRSEFSNELEKTPIFINSTEQRAGDYQITFTFDGGGFPFEGENEEFVVVDSLSAVVPTQISGDGRDRTLRFDGFLDPRKTNVFYILHANDTTYLSSNLENTFVLFAGLNFSYDFGVTRIERGFDLSRLRTIEQDYDALKETWGIPSDREFLIQIAQTDTFRYTFDDIIFRYARQDPTFQSDVFVKEFRDILLDPNGTRTPILVNIQAGFFGEPTKIICAVDEDCGVCNSCVNGQCEAVSFGSDPLNQCKDVDCSDYYFGFVGGVCYGRASIQSVCNGAGACTQVSEDDCPVSGRGESSGVSCSECQQESGCSGTTMGSCSVALDGTDCMGLCSQCVSGACRQAPSDDASCGTIDCDNLDGYSVVGDNSASGSASCVLRDYSDLTSNRCEGLLDCRDPNTAPDCSVFTDRTLANCGVCQRVQSCSPNGATCTTYPANTPCGPDRVCTETGQCVRSPLEIRGVKRFTSGNYEYGFVRIYPGGKIILDGDNVAITVDAFFENNGAVESNTFSPHLTIRGREITGSGPYALQGGRGRYECGWNDACWWGSGGDSSLVLDASAVSTGAVNVRSGSGGPGGRASVIFRNAQNGNVASLSVIGASGANSGISSFGCSGYNGGSADVSFESSSLNIGSVVVQGGDASSPACVGEPGTGGSATFRGSGSGASITFTSSFNLEGGDGTSGYSSYYRTSVFGRGGSAEVSLSNGGDVSFLGPVNLQGGIGGYSSGAGVMSISANRLSQKRELVIAAGQARSGVCRAYTCWDSGAVLNSQGGEARLSFSGNSYTSEGPVTLTAGSGFSVSSGGSALVSIQATNSFSYTSPFTLRAGNSFDGCLNGYYGGNAIVDINSQTISGSSSFTTYGGNGGRASEPYWCNDACYERVGGNGGDSLLRLRTSSTDPPHNGQGGSVGGNAGSFCRYKQSSRPTNGRFATERY
ncbi:hypothetical protein J4430_02750 [Candidatus Woesearchaeota archaeon]|nr:hypothetical protein [Candidatus Woesearchaeota archaeon]